MGATASILRRLQSLFNKQATEAPQFNQEMTCYGDELDLQAEHLASAAAQLNMVTAEGRWLDIWGSIFGTYRIEGEEDSAYAQRIKEEVLVQKVNNFAISASIKKLTGYDTDIIDLGISNEVTTPLGGGPEAHNRFAVRIYALREIPTIHRMAIKNVVLRSKASGKKPVYFIPTGLLIANDPATTMNTPEFVVGPASSQWGEFEL